VELILERFLAVKDIENAPVFATRHPALDDYLPSNNDTFPRKASESKVLGVCTDTKGPPEVSEIAFADVDAYPALAQAMYLLGRVLNYIKSEVQMSELRKEEFALLGSTVLSFGQSLIRQAEGSSLDGHYCTSFFISVM